LRNKDASFMVARPARFSTPAIPHSRKSFSAAPKSP
jgi:hypothetical protein